jgi:orotate phosphoribosyltransferase
LITWIATLWYHAQVLPQFENTEHRMTTQATFNPQAFIELALSRGVLKFGEFTLKSGRVSPYFFNAGLLNDGEALSLLASGYAAKLTECNNVEVVFGPAYKGIPFVAATAVALSQNHGVSVPWGLTVKKPKIMVKAGSWLVHLLQAKSLDY